MSLRARTGRPRTDDAEGLRFEAGSQPTRFRNARAILTIADLDEPHDFIGTEAVWTRQQPASRKFADDLKARGGDVEFVELPKIGITGNSHMLMMDTNSDQIADFIQAWMKRKSLMN
jgi:hypothetical protein